MNFYQHHIGDYASLTGHLSPMEDIAYRRALERYYKTEAPLDLDAKRVARLLRLAEHAEAVEAVLQEFFEETPEGWRNKRADEEIERMQEKQEVADERDQHEKTRMQRHREKRSAMFALLADVGVYPAFNAKTAELEKAMSDAGVTLAVTPSPKRSDGSGYGTRDDGDKPATASRAHSPEPQPSPLPIPEPSSLNTLVLTDESPRPSDREPGGINLLGHQLNGHAPKTVPDCPHLEILALWAEVMPDLPQHDPDMWPDSARADHLRARWRTTAALKGWASKDDGLRYFRKLFGFCRNSDFLMGKAQTRDRRPFVFELAWLVNATNWTKVHEGKFNG